MPTIAHSFRAVGIGQLFERVTGNVLSDDNQARLLAHGILQRFGDGIAVVQHDHLLVFLLTLRSLRLGAR